LLKKKKKKKRKEKKRKEKKKKGKIAKCISLAVSLSRSLVAGVISNLNICECPVTSPSPPHPFLPHPTVRP
jgi:uncharacterized protein YqhQ